MTPQEGTVVVYKDFSDFKSGIKNAQWVAQAFKESQLTVLSGKQGVCLILGQGLREARECQAELRSQVTIVPKWYCTNRSIGACAVGDNTVSEACRRGKQLEHMAI